MHPDHHSSIRPPRRIDGLAALVGLALLSAGARGDALVGASASVTAAAAEDTPLVWPIDRSFGDTRAVALAGRFAYYGSGRTLAVADVGDVRTPHVVGRTASLPPTTWNAAAPPAFLDLAVGEAGSGVLWAITGDPDDGVLAYDLRDPIRPRLRGRLAGLWRPVAIAAVGRDVVVATRSLAEQGAGSVLLVGGPSLAAPGLLAEEEGLAVNDVAWNGEVVVAAGWSVDVALLGLAPDSAGRLGFVDRGRLVRTDAAEMDQVGVIGCRLYGGIQGMIIVRVYDLCDARGLRLLGRINGNWPGGPPYRDQTPGAMAAGTVAGRDRLYFMNGYSDVLVADVPEPPNGRVAPRVLHSGLAPLPHCQSAMSADEERVAAAGCGLTVGAGAVAEGMGHLAGLPSAGPFEFAPNIRFVASSGTTYAQAGGVLTAIEPQEAGGAHIAGQYALSDPVFGVAGGEWGLAVAGGTAWIVQDIVDGVVVGVDVSRPDHMSEVGRLLTFASSGSIAADGELLVAAGDGLALFDVSAPGHPRRIGSLDWRHSPATGDIVRLRSNGLLISVADTIELFDVSVPSVPRLVGTRDWDGDEDLTYADLGDELVVVTDRVEMAIHSRTPIDGRLPLLARVPLAAPRREVPPDTKVRMTTVNGIPVAVVVTGDLLRAIDLSDPTKPRLGRVHALGYVPSGLAVMGDRAYVLGGAGLEVVSFGIGPLSIAGVLHLPWLAASSW